MKSRGLIASVEYKNIPGGGVLVIFTNEITGEKYSRPYKTAAAAKAQATRFFDRMGRIYNA